MESFDTPAEEEDDSNQADDTPIVRFVNKMLLDAIKTGASDIHFEPYEHSYRVRFRTDGILQEVSAPPQNLGTRLAARLKVMAELDISERRVPQDGRMKLRLGGNNIDVRVSTIPSIYGEKVVLRILHQQSIIREIDELGFSPAQSELYRSLATRPESPRSRQNARS